MSNFTENSAEVLNPELVSTEMLPLFIQGMKRFPNHPIIEKGTGSCRIQICNRCWFTLYICVRWYAVHSTVDTLADQVHIGEWVIVPQLSNVIGTNLALSAEEC